MCSLLTELRQKLAEAERELQNRDLLAYTRRQLERRAERLTLEITELERPMPFLECSTVNPPVPRRGASTSQEREIAL